MLKITKKFGSLANFTDICGTGRVINYKDNSINKVIHNSNSNT